MNVDILTLIQSESFIQPECAAYLFMIVAAKPWWLFFMVFTALILDQDQPLITTVSDNVWISFTPNYYKLKVSLAFIEEWGAVKPNGSTMWV